MSPSVLRQSGAKRIKDGEEFTPRAMIHFCDGCGWEGAPFGDKDGDKRLYFCGWVDDQPACIGKGTVK